MFQQLVRCRWSAMTLRFAWVHAYIAYTHAGGVWKGKWRQGWASVLVSNLKTTLSSRWIGSHLLPSFPLPSCASFSWQSHANMKQSPAPTSSPLPIGFPGCWCSDDPAFTVTSHRRLWYNCFSLTFDCAQDTFLFMKWLRGGPGMQCDCSCPHKPLLQR